jgi:hypothetical protein
MLTAADGGVFPGAGKAAQGMDVRHWRVGSFVAGIVLSTSAAPVAAQELLVQVGPVPIEIHGFASQGFILTTSNDYIAADTTRGSFQLSEAGINFTAQLTDKLRLGLQLFAQNFGLVGNYDITADWFYLDYRWRDWFGVRAGRLKVPFGLYNEVNDIDSARVPVLLPQSFYPLQARSFLFAQTGIELYGFARSRLAGALEYRLYAGTIFIDADLLNPPDGSVRLQLNVPLAVGSRVVWETPVPGLRLAGSVLAVRLDVLAFAAGMTIPITNESLLAAGSLEYSLHPLTLTAEYSRWRSQQDSPLPTSVFDTVSERMYAMVSLVATSWLQTSVYYALHFPDIANRAGAPNRQHDVALTLRFDVNQHWLIKLEAHYMDGTAGLVNPLRVNPAMVEVQPRWAVFLAKTTASF